MFILFLQIRQNIIGVAADSTSNSMATLTVQGVLLLGAFWGVFGINVDELSGELEKRLETEQYRDYFPDNLIKISSWNVRYIPTRTICNFIEKTKPMVRIFSCHVTNCLKVLVTDYMLLSMLHTYLQATRYLFSAWSCRFCKKRLGSCLFFCSQFSHL